MNCVRSSVSLFPFRKSALFLGLLVAVVEPLIVRRHYHDGVLYEDFAADSDNVRYTITNGEGWDDLKTLVTANNLRAKSMFCTRGPGAWLLYQEANYQYGSTRQLKLVYGEHCIPADNINSVQPLGAVYLNVEDTSAVVAFSEKYFASKGETFRDASGSISQNIKSAIFTGTGNWTLEAEGKKTCLMIQNLGDVCLLEDLQNSFSLTSDQVTFTKNCKNDTEEVEVYQLQTCYSKGFHELTYDFDFTLPFVQKICTGPYDPEDQAKHKFLSVVKLWKNRITPPTKLNTPTDVPNAPQRLNVLNAMVTIMQKTCKGVSDAFLDIIKLVYLMHIKNGEIWNVTTTPDGIRLEQGHARWTRAQKFIMECLDHDEEVGTDCQPEDISDVRDAKEIATIEDYLNGESYDFVIEHVWLLLNYVSPYCNYKNGYKTNDWSVFPLMFKRDFLYPLQKQWKQPGKWATYYPVMFTGYNMEDERKHMIACVQAMIKKTPFYDPLARPPGFYKGNSTVDRDIVGGVNLGNETEATNSSKKTKRENVVEVVTETTVVPTTLKPTTASTPVAPPTTTLSSSSSVRSPTEPPFVEETTAPAIATPAIDPTSTKRKKKKTQRVDTDPIVLEVGPTTPASGVVDPLTSATAIDPLQAPPFPPGVKGKKKGKGAKGKKAKKAGNGTKKARAKLLKGNMAIMKKPRQRSSLFLGDRESVEFL